MPRIPSFCYTNDGTRARTRERQRTMSSTQFHGKDTNVQTGGLESHRWLDRHKRSIMKPWRKKTVTADMGKYFHRQSFLYHSNNNPNAQIHLCVPKIQTEILRLQVQVKEKLSTEFSLSQALCNRDTFHSDQRIMCLSCTLLRLWLRKYSELSTN